MIVILCSSYTDACDAYYFFKHALEEIDPTAIRHFYDPAYCVETDDDLRYLFTDRHIGPRLFREMKNVEYVDSDQFFEGMEYYCVEELF